MYLRVKSRPTPRPGRTFLRLRSFRESCIASLRSRTAAYQDDVAFSFCRTSLSAIVLPVVYAEYRQRALSWPKEVNVLRIYKFGFALTLNYCTRAGPCLRGGSYNIGNLRRHLDRQEKGRCLSSALASVSRPSKIKGETFLLTLQPATSCALPKICFAAPRAKKIIKEKYLGGQSEITEA